MKNIKSYLFALLILSLLLTVIIFSTNKSKPLIALHESVNEGLESPGERIKWEISRLMDPETGKVPMNIRKRETAFAQQLPKDYEFLRNSVNTWVNIGPYSVGGRTRAFAVDVSNENIFLAGAVSGGIWRSNDQGKNWLRITPPDQFLSVSCISQDKRPGKTDTWYYGTGECYGNSASASGAYFYGNGVYKSTDNGLTWSVLPATSSEKLTEYDPWDVSWNIATDPSNDTQDVVYVALIRRLYRSSDGGQNFTLVLGGNYGSYFTDVAVTSKGVVYATMSSDGNQKGIWRSPDGINWTNIMPADTFPPEYDRIVIGIDPNNENVVYFLAHTPGYGKLALRSRDEEDWNSLWKYRYLKDDGSLNKGIWENLSDNIPSKENRDFGNFSAQGSYNMVVRVKPGDSNVVFIAGTNLYRSDDAFRTPNHIRQIGGYGVGTKRPNWIVYPNNHPDHHEVAFLSSNPDVLINANDGGLFITKNNMADTVVWDILNNGYLTTQLYTVSIEDKENSDFTIIGLQDNGNYVSNSSDPKANWAMPLNGDGSYSAIAKDRDFCILSTQLGRMVKMKLDDQGNRLTFTRIDPIGAKDYQFINPFELDPNDENKLYLAAGRRLWRNDSITYLPFKENYDSITSGWFLISDSVNFPNRVITSVAVSKSNPAHRLYIGTSASILYRIDNADKGDPDFQRITSLLNGGNISCIAIHPDNADKILAVFSNYNVYSLFYSDNGGSSWSKVGGNLEENTDGTGDGPSLRWVSILPIKGKNLYLAGTSIGLFGTDSLEGLNTKWIQLGAKTIGNVVVDMIKVRPSDGQVVVATHGSGLFSAKFTSVEEALGTRESRYEQDFGLCIYPNPVKNELIFYPSCLSENMLTYRILDMKGTLVLSGSTAAKYRLSIDVNSLIPGAYLLFTESGKIKKCNKFIKLP